MNNRSGVDIGGGRGLGGICSPQIPGGPHKKKKKIMFNVKQMDKEKKKKITLHAICL